MSTRRYGLETLASSPDDADVDIVFVHGLSGSRRKTWVHADGTFWPNDLLTKDLPKARINLFGYDASVPKLFAESSINTLRDHGTALCNDVTMLRLRTESIQRPIIFVAHSLGGLVCEQALLISSGSPETYEQALLECTVGVVFMGTPHSGADIANMVSTLARLIRLVRPTNREILNVLTPSSEVMANLQQEFHRMIERRTRDGKHDIQLFWFFEELPMKGVGIIVEHRSATLPRYGQLGIHGNHKTMTKFTKDCSGYARVRDKIVVWVAQATDSRPTIFDLAVATHVRTITKKFVPSGRPETDLASQHGYLSKFLQSLRAHPSRLEAAQQRTDRLSELTWKLYGECDEIAALRCFSSKLGILNIQFRRASDHIKQGAVDNLMQDMLLNLTDGCYGILLNLEEQIKQSHQNHDLRSQEDWSKIVWGDDQISWRREALQVYCQGIEAMNTNITSQSGVVVMRKFISYIQDIQQGRDEVSVLSQSLDYINAEDVKSEVVWETLRTDLQTSGLSTRMLNKHRASIVAKFGELLDTESIDSQRQPAEPNEESTSLVSEPDDDIYGTESEDFDDGTQWDFSTPEVLLLAARSGRLDIMKKAIDAWPSLDTTDRQGNTALHLASAGGHVGVVEVLLGEGSDPNIKSRRGSTAIRQALENGHHAVIKCIINLSPHKETINARVDGLGHTALHSAASLGDEDSVSLLLTAGADPNILNGFNQTPLHLAASKRDLMVVKSLLDADSDLDVEDFWGDTAFEVAISTPFNELNKDGVIRVFLEHRVMLLEAEGQTLNVDFDSAAQFLAMESIYDANSSENIFKLSAQGGDISQLLPKQFEMNDLAEDLWEAFYQ